VLKQVLDVLGQKEEILREKLVQSTTSADRKRLHGELAILNRQRQKGEARLEALSPRSLSENRGRSEGKLV
jgi:hypothetical protein